MFPQRMLLAILLVTLLVWLLVWAVQRRMSLFEIRIRDGRAAVRSGSLRMGFLADVQEICDRNAIAVGKVRGVRSGRLIRLSFSGSISPEARQQMRNAWAVLRAG